MRGIDQTELERKLDLVIEKLMNLEDPQNEEALAAGGEKIGSRAVWAVEDHEDQKQGRIQGFPVRLV